jgi:thiol-disulfide isomerase/thioredoxin
MTRQNTRFTLSALLGISAAMLGGHAQADEVVTISLTPAATGGQPAMSPRKIELSETKAAGITREPLYRNTPRYGSLTLGDAKTNKILLVLDAAPNSKGMKRLFVDANGNGDLTDEQPLTLTASPAAGTRTTAGNADERTTARAQVTARYNVAGRGGLVDSVLNFTYWGDELTVNREYSRGGVLKIGDKSYRIALVDQGVAGTFNDFRHDEDDPAKVTVLVDKDGDGKFNMQKEAFDAAKPFRILNKFEVVSIDPRGTTIRLKKSGSSVTAKDLRVGGEAIDFEATKFDSKATVAFPGDYERKIVLLDFWAVWCPPCREEVPNIVRVYEEYHDKGFEILGVSLDRKGDDTKLKDFMQEFGMTWDQIFDGGYWKAEVAQLYGVDSIPHALLVDGSTGTILAMGNELRGEGLEKAVKKALAKKK